MYDDRQFLEGSQPAKNAAKTEGLKKARDKYKKWNQAEKEFQNTAAKKTEELQKAQDRWGRTEYVPGKDAKSLSRKKTNDPIRRNATDYIDVNDPKFNGLSPGEKAKVISRLMEESKKNGTLEEWEYNHVVPRSNIPAQ